MKEKQVKIEDAQYRRTWGLKIRCATPNMEKAADEEEEGEEEEECRNAFMGSIALPRKLKHVNPIHNPTHPQVLVIWRELIKYVNSGKLHIC